MNHLNRIGETKIDRHNLIWVDDSALSDALFFGGFAGSESSCGLLASSVGLRTILSTDDSG